MEDKDYGLLLRPSDIKLQRTYFKQMTSLLGVNVVYRAPRPDKHYTVYTEIDSNYMAPEIVGCICEEHPEQQTLKKLGWMAELQEDASIIHVPYDLHDIQQGALFILPSAIDNAKGRLFRVVKLSTIMIYPASISCMIVPEYEDTFAINQFEHKHTNFNLLSDEEDD